MYQVVLISLLVTSFSSAQDDIQKWLQKENKSLQKYISKEDAQFIEFLKKEWKYYPLSKGIVFDEKPKIEVAPIYKPSKEIETSPTFPIDDITIQQKDLE